MVTARVPPHSLTAMIDKEIKDPDFYVLKSGVTVKLDMTTIGDAAERGESGRRTDEETGRDRNESRCRGHIEFVGSTARDENNG